MLGNSKLLVSAISSFNNKGIKDAQKSISGFEKNLKHLAASVGIAFSTAAVVNFAKVSVQAFAKNEAQIAILSNTLKNLGLSYADANSQDFVKNLSLTTGVLKDELIPAYQKFLLATHSVAQSQSSLQLALDVSRGTGKDLATVTQAMSKAFLGNTTSLTRLGAGLDKAILKTGDMKQITGVLSDLFQGDAATYAKTFSGQLSVLGANAEEAKITIGSGLVDALKILAGSKGIEGINSQMQSFAESIATTTTNIALMIGEIKKIPGLTELGKFAAMIIGAPLIGLNRVMKQKKASQNTGSNFTYSLGVNSVAEINAAKDRQLAAKALKDHTALQKIANAADLAKLKQSQDQATLDALKAKFDTDRIGITLALSQATDAHTKLVLQGQLDIMNSDATGAAKRLTALDTELASMQETAKRRKELDDAAQITADALGSTTAFTTTKLDLFGKALLDLTNQTLDAANAAQNMGESIRGQSRTVFAPSNVANGNPFYYGAAPGNTSSGAVTPGPNFASEMPQNSVIVLPAIVTDTPGFSAAVQDVVQTITRNGSPLSGSASRGD